MIKKLNGNMIFQIVINVVLTILAICAVMPFLLLLISSVTDETVLLSNGYSYFPDKFSLDAYKYLFGKAGTMVRAYGITLLVTTIGTTISLFITPMLAYPLSRQDFKHRNVVSFIVFFTMLFNGGLVPSYLMWTTVFHLKNTIPALILPTLLMSAFNVILMKNYFKSNIPPSLIEAAQVDGAGEFLIYFKVVLPLSLPIMATIGLFVGIAYWNDWQNGLYYITKPELFSLQNLLNRILREIQFLSSMGSNVQQSDMVMPSTSMRMALAVIGILPIMVLYPFFQKYFVKGITVGAVKG